MVLCILREELSQFSLSIGQQCCCRIHPSLCHCHKWSWWFLGRLGAWPCVEVAFLMLRIEGVVDDVVVDGDGNEGIGFYDLSLVSIPVVSNIFHQMLHGSKIVENCSNQWWQWECQWKRVGGFWPWNSCQWSVVILHAACNCSKLCSCYGGAIWWTTYHLSNKIHLLCCNHVWDTWDCIKHLFHSALCNPSSLTCVMLICRILCMLLSKNTLSLSKRECHRYHVLQPH